MKKCLKLMMGGITVTILLGVNGCNDSGSQGKFGQIHGIWERSGYGDVLVVDGEGADFYQYTRQTCLKEERLDNDELGTIIDDLKITEAPKAFSVIPPLSPAFRVHFSQLNELPVTCQGDRLITKPTPVNVFEHLWHNFNDYYAFFNERGVDWQQQYVTYRPLVRNDMNDEALLAVLTDLLSPINDGHIGLEYGDEAFSPEQPSRLVLALIDAFRQQDEITDFDEFIGMQVERAEQVQNSYLKTITEMGGPDNNAVSWGQINNRVGYLSLDRMALISSEHGFDDLDDLTGAEDVEAIKGIMEQVVSDFQGIEALVIDVRSNGGGFDAVGLAMANYFVGEPALALSKYPRTHKGIGRKVEAFLQPEDNSLQVPIAVLMSQESVSAAETFLMAMTAVPDVTLVGEFSNGTLSDTLSKLLPNGWEVTLSNELYFDNEGRNYEVIGVPADVDVAAFDLDGFANGKDTALETAIDVLMQQLL